MWRNSQLQQHIATNLTLDSQALVVAEWNMNDPENFRTIGNYRFRPGTDEYDKLISMFDPNDAGDWWTNATLSDVTVAGTFDEYSEPTLYMEEYKKSKLLWSLDDCFKPHRPRSGINYPLYGTGRYLNGTRVSAERPRYYMASYDNNFKYWTSFRREGGVERGISRFGGKSYHIQDTSPFIVYKKSIPTNKIVVKCQTNIGSVNYGTFRSGGKQMKDPLYGEENATTPRRWDIQILSGNSWLTIKSFGENDRRSDGSPIIGPDGYVELTYGLIIPERYSQTPRYLGTVSSDALIPKTALEGDYYYVVTNENDLGVVYIWSNGQWEVFFPSYGWSLNENYDYVGQHLVSDMTRPIKFEQGKQVFYREFQYIDGMRLVVHTMNQDRTPFDLIEMSPRLQIDVTDRTATYKTTKAAGNVDNTALPVGSLRAGTGSIDIFDFDDAFTEDNGQSIVSDHLKQNITFSFYDVIRNVNNADYYIPIKKLHSEGKFPSYSDHAMVNFELRDSFYILENEPAPSIMLTNVSLSNAVSVLLDSIGFSNYVFRFVLGKPEPVIPFFFIAPDQNVAEVLEKLAQATQSAMFFDEYNNFVVMSKEHLLPEGEDRGIDVFLNGNDPIPGKSLPNIVDIASMEKKVYNTGQISYTERYIQRSIGSLTQASFVNEDQNYIYLPALLWEVSGTEATRTVNDKATTQSTYSLGAMPLNSDLLAIPPSVSKRKIINNVIDVGEAVYWLPRYKGYLYANGEIIRFDAVQYQIQGQGTKWISSNEEYQKYLGQLPFNGKMFPTGIVRIFAEPYYEVINGETFMKNGAVARHGRAQFGTEITRHESGIGDYWLNDAHVRGIDMESQYLFEVADPPDTVLGRCGWGPERAQASTRNGIIKNFFRDVNYSEGAIRRMLTAQAGTIQSSALVFAGAQMKSSVKPRNFLTYVFKNFGPQPFQHFGTRMRIIGKVEAASDVGQSPVGSMTYYSTMLNGESLVLNGGSGGMGIGVNPETNNGYFFEIVALTNTNLNDISSSDDLVGGHNVIFYKVAKESGPGSQAIPIKLWGGLADILVDSGTFAGQGRQFGEDGTTVYDLSVEWEDIGASRKFYLYINGQQIATVVDSLPLPMYSTMCLFVRGTSKAMFENVYALRQSLSVTTSGRVVSDSLIAEAFDKDKVDARDFRRYGISGIVQKSYLSGLSTGSPPAYNMYYDEFGTIMRECAYFDVKYDKAYPALLAQISPTFNDSPGYSISGFTPGAYGARFLIFNVTDKALNLDETSGNYLRIQGVTFTQNTTHEYTMDNHFNNTGNLSDPNPTPDGNILRSPRTEYEKFRQIKINRMKYGKSEWTMQSDYIQSQSTAENLMGWLANKTTRPRQLVGVEVFHDPTIQLGDIATIDYRSNDGAIKVAPSGRKFVIYNIEHSRDAEGPKTTLYLSET